MSSRPSESSIHSSLAKQAMSRARDAHRGWGNPFLRLYNAILSDNEAVVLKAIQRWSADVNKRPEGFETTALITAVKVGNPHVVSWLLDAGAEVNATAGKEGRLEDALQAAALEDVDVARVLLSYGANVTATNWRGDTALHVAAGRRWGTPMTKTMLNYGSEVNATNLRGRTALHKAAAKGNAETVGLLLDWGAELNLVDFQGFTALKLAGLWNHQPTIKVLKNAFTDELEPEPDTVGEAWEEAQKRIAAAMDQY